MILLPIRRNEGGAHLEHLTDFAIAYFTKLKEKYGKGRERQTDTGIF
jgi:topoisomerase-4 subunit A